MARMAASRAHSQASICGFAVYWSFYNTRQMII